MNKFSVSIIIPNWNGQELLEKNLPLILEAKKNKANNIKEIIIIDDKSSDDSVKFILKNYSREVRVIKHTKNRGFSASVNTAARMAKYDLLCLLNSDVAPEKDFFEKLIDNFNNEKVFAVSLHEKGFGPALGKFTDGFIVHEPVAEKNNSEETFWVSGGSGVFRRSYWMDLGGLDEKLFSPFYWEDVDISYRGLKRGYKLLWESKSLVFHEHEVTVNKSRFSKRSRQVIQERNQLLFVWKNLTSKPLFKKHLKGLLNRIRSHPGYIKVVIAALLKINTIKVERKKEIKESVVSDEAIFSMFNR